MKALIQFTIVLGLLVLMYQPAAAQPGVLNYWQVASGNWTTTTNWSRGVLPDGQDVSGDDFAVIGGTNGPNGISVGAATVNTNVGPMPGGVILGNAAADSGTLTIDSGGTLTVADTDFDGDGRMQVGSAGTGTLVVNRGGMLSAVSITSGGNANSSITLGGGSVGTANVSIGSATLGRMLRIIGADVNFSATGAVEFQGTSTYVPEITGAMHSTITTTSTATLGGTLQLDFTSFTPTPANTWNLVDATSITGSFNIVPDPEIVLNPGQTFAVRTISGGNGQIAELFVTQLLVLSVNRNTGAVTISNPGASGIVFDGYGIQSALGSLNPSDAIWNSLEEQPGLAGTNWFEANPTANHLAELRSSNTSTIGGGQSWSLGNVFDPPAPTEFGQTAEDLVFTYNDPVTEATVTSIVQYTGSGSVNNLVLFVNPDTGQVQMRNTSPFTVEIDGYTISSTGGSLNSNPAAWTSLEEQVGNTWAEANLSDTRVSELQSSGSTMLVAGGGTTFNLGGLFNTADPKDLVFQFVLANANVPGDYNNNGIVDAADFTVWRDHLGQTFQLANEVTETTPGEVTMDDYDAWKARFGLTAGEGEATARTGVVIYEAPPAGGGSLAAVGAVPEPASWLLVCLGGLLTSLLRPGKR
jgi:hypothetical protein